MYVVKFRFYAELNDFLPKQRNQKWIESTFENPVLIADAIESFGVPMEKVDVVLVNHESVNCNYKLENEDEISVFPEFELLDISSVSKLPDRPLRNPRFVCDAHLGRLAKYLRMTGFDTLYSNDYKDDQLTNIVIKQKRILLSRDYELIKEKLTGKAIWIPSERPKEQIKYILAKLDLYHKINPLFRCLLCNTLIVSIDKKDITHRLQPKTAKYFDAFYICPCCDKIYWKGSHYENMLKEIQQTFLQ